MELTTPYDALHGRNKGKRNTTNTEMCHVHGRYKGSVIAIVAHPALQILYLVWLDPSGDILNTLQRDSEGATTVPAWPDSGTFTTLNTGKEWLKHPRPGGSVRAPTLWSVYKASSRSFLLVPVHQALSFHKLEAAVPLESHCLCTKSISDHPSLRGKNVQALGDSQKILTQATLLQPRKVADRHPKHSNPFPNTVRHTHNSRQSIFI